MWGCNNQTLVCVWQVKMSAHREKSNKTLMGFLCMQVWARKKKRANRFLKLLKANFRFTRQVVGHLNSQW